VGQRHFPAPCRPAVTRKLNIQRPGLIVVEGGSGGVPPHHHPGQTKIARQPEGQNRWRLRHRIPVAPARRRHPGRAHARPGMRDPGGIRHRRHRAQPAPIDQIDRRIQIGGSGRGNHARGHHQILRQPDDRNDRQTNGRAHPAKPVEENRHHQARRPCTTIAGTAENLTGTRGLPRKNAFTEGYKNREISGIAHETVQSWEDLLRSAPRGAVNLGRGAGWAAPASWAVFGNLKCPHGGYGFGMRGEGSRTGLDVDTAQAAIAHSGANTLCLRMSVHEDWSVAQRQN
jgi:hypothetical protein